MKMDETRTFFLQLDRDEAAALYEYAVRTLRITDGLRSCPLPEGACTVARDLADELRHKLDLPAPANYPETATERIVVDAADEALRARRG